MFPDRDRVETLLASGIDVIAATDHDACSSYAEGLASLGAAARVRILPGVEMTPLIPYDYPPGSTTPKTFGHFNGWPIAFDPSRPRNGAPWDETHEPGVIFDRLRAVMTAPGVVQLNHPVAESKIGRDEGFLRVLGWRPDRGIPATDDGSRLGVLHRRPAGATAANDGFDTVEAMQGGGVLLNMLHRDLWHAFLDHGILRAATADSDSHSLQVEPMGYPRNVVSAGMTLATFDVARFNAAVREGRSVGTNGAYIEATIQGRDGQAHAPSTQPFQPAEGADIALEVRAAPWIPVTEVRIFVNGRVLRTIGQAELMTPTDPFGTEGTVRFRGRVAIPADDLRPGADRWVVIEAGVPLPRGVDAEGDDGLIDHIDGNNDGRISLGELDANGDGRIGESEDPVDRDGDGRIDPGEVAMAPPPEDSPGYHLHVVSPGMLSWAFTNAFLLDATGDGWRAPRR